MTTFIAGMITGGVITFAGIMAWAMCACARMADEASNMDRTKRRRVLDSEYDYERCECLGRDLRGRDA